MVSFGSYLLGAFELALVAGSVGFSAYRLRTRFLPSWTGAPARLVETIVAVALLIWISELIGTFGLFYPGILVAACALTAGIIALSLAGGGGAGDAAPTGPASENPWSLVVMTLVIAVVVGHWA